ncbi:MAG TPA: hypothetical protein VHA30_01280 [Patescibacteria group bacterium]|nr:hypothetical protein [Patescibacteria group bacterium]
MSKKVWYWIAGIAVIIIAGGGGFFGGMKYQQAKTLKSFAGRVGQFTAQGARTGGQRPGGLAGGGNDFVNGQVVSKDTNTITVKLANGGSKVVVFGPSAQFRKAVDGTADDVSVGSSVTITGTDNSDGSITAQSVQIRTDQAGSQGAPMIPAPAPSQPAQ